MTDFDLIIIGSGPAGMSAATQAAKLGANVVILDEQAHLGGQIYRNITNSSPAMKKLLGSDYAKGGKLVEQLGLERITHIRSAVVWNITADCDVFYTVKGAAHQVRGRYLLLATGAIERPVPVPGWTLPGVMTAGAAQILIKSSRLVAKRAVLAGSGPLLYLVAAQMTAAGAPPLALVETNTLADHLRAVRHIGGAIIGWKAIIKGLGLLWKLKRAGVKRYRGVESFSVIGQTDVEGIRIVRSGQTLDIECKQVFLHQGVVPNTQLSRALQLDHEWSDLQRCFKPVTDTWGKTSNPRVYVAGDGAGIGGAIAAELRGSLCAIKVLSELGKIDPQSLNTFAKPKLRALSKELALRPFLDVLYPVPDFIANPDDNTLICRCEEVSAGAIREYAKLGCMGPNQTKAFGRPGMGPCQGRNCGLTVTEILARAHNKPAAEIGAYKIRMPIKPVSLGEMASLAETQVNNQANNQVGGEEGQ